MFNFFHKLDKPSRRILVICYFAFFCNGMLSLMLGSFLPDLKAQYGISDTVSGLFLSAHSIGNLIAGIVSGIVPLVLGERKSIVLLYSMAFLGFLMMVVTGNPLWLFIAFALTGFGRGSVTSFDNRTVNRISGGSPSASNCLHASFALGAIAAPLVFLVLSRVFSWKAGPIFVAGCICISIFSLSRMKLDREYPDRKNKANRTFEFFRNPSFLILAAMMFCYVCCEYTVNGWLVTYIQNKEELVSSFNASGDALENAVKTYSQTMATLLWAVMLVGRLGCAALSAKISQKKLMFISSLGVVGFFILMLSSSSIAAVTTAIAGLGLSMAGISPMIYSDAAVFTNRYQMATSCLLATGSAGSIIMNTLVGALSDRYGFSSGMGAITVAVILLAVMAFLNIVVKTRNPEETA